MGRISCDSTPRTMSILMVAALVSTVLGNVDSSSRVYGGEIISEFEFPFVLSFQRLNVLLNRWEHICGASLIQPEWALISANCLNKNSILTTRVVGAEWSFREDSGQEQYRNPSRFIIHPNRSHPGPDYNDIGLIKVPILMFHSSTTISSKCFDVFQRYFLRKSK